jgi:sugar phosphate permease
MPEPEPPAREATRLPPIVRALGAVSFLNDLASEMVYPLLPQLLTRGLGAGALALGALDGFSDAAASVVKLGAGWLSDRPRRRGPLIVGGYLVAAAARPIMALVGAAWQVIGLRVTDRVGKGARNPPRDAVIADAVPASMRGRAFGFHRAMDHAGATVGPLVAAALMAGLAMPVAHVILWSVIPGVAAVLIAVTTLRGVERARERAAVAPSAHPGTGEGASAGARTSGGMVLLVIVFAGVRLPETLVLLRLQDLGVAAVLIPVLWAALHVVRSSASYPGGWLSDRVGPGPTTALGWVLYAGVAAGLAAASGPVSAGAGLMGLGLVSACTEAPERALVAAWGGRTARGRRFGVYHAALGLAALPGGLALGALYARAGGATALTVSAGLSLVLSVVAVPVLMRQRP